MAVTDTQFAQMLKGKGGAKPTLLAEIEFAYQTASGPATGLIYLADRSYRSKPTDAPANVGYRDVIMGSPSFERKIDETKLGGRGAMSVGALVLNNADGRLDYLLDAIVDGRSVSFYVGDLSWARNDFRLVNVAVVSQVKADSDKQISIGLRDKSFLIDDTIIGSPIPTGQNAGKPKPILLGTVRNLDIGPYMLDSANLVYCLNDFALASSTMGITPTIHVRDSGIDLRDTSLLSPLFTFDNTSMSANAGTDTLTYTSAHGLNADDVILFSFSGGSLFTPLQGGVQYWVLASGLTANNFKLSASKGGTPIDITGTTLTAGPVKVIRQRHYVDTAAATVQLSGSPAGRVTVDISILDAAGELTSLQTPHEVFQYVLKHYTQLSASEYDAAGMTALSVIEASENSVFGRAILDRVNVLDLLDEIALASFSWYASNAAGVLTVGRLDLSNLDSATPIASITKFDMSGDLSCENLTLPWGKVILDSRMNYAVQTDGIAGSVTAANRSLWGQPFQMRVSTTDPAGTDYLGNWWDYHKSAIDSKPIASDLQGGEQSACDSITKLFKPWTRIYKCTVGAERYALNPGDCVTLTYPRYGLSAGSSVRVMSVNPRFSDGLCDLTFARQVTPDYSTASHA